MRVARIRLTASALKVPLQLAVRRSGGTDAKAIQARGGGVPTVVIGVPARYIHTHVSLIHLQDYLWAKRLVAELVRRLDARAAASFVDFGANSR